MTYSGSRYDLLLYGGETIFRNVAFQTVTPYKQAMAGTYQFYVTSSGNYSFLREIPIIVIGFGRLRHHCRKQSGRGTALRTD